MTVHFYPVKLSCFAEKKKVHRKYQNFIGTLMNQVKCLFYEQKISEVKHVLEGSGLSNVIISLILLKVVQVMIFNIECPHNYVCVCFYPKLACNLWQLHRFMGMHGNQGTGCNLSLTLVA